MNMFFMNSVLAAFFWSGSVIIEWTDGTINPGEIY